MKKKTIGLIIVLTINLVGAVFNVNANRLPDYQSIDIGPRLRDTDMEINVDNVERLEVALSSVESGGNGASLADSSVGDIKLGLWYDDVTGLYLDLYQVRAVGTYAEVWVDLNLAWPDGDPRPYPEVTDEQINYLLQEFDSNIYPTDTDYFGTPDYHDGSGALMTAWFYGTYGEWADYTDSGGKSIIMISNIGDESYYDPTYPSYIAGFYWGAYEDYFDRNIINIDTWDWGNRVGPDGSKPFMYEGTIAHEYQHLIHADYIPSDETFINEGFSDFAEFLCGYGMPWGHINAYLATPDNSLIEWGDQGGINILADYGAAALFAIYMNDRFGDDFISNFMAAKNPGLVGLNYAFTPFGVDFYQVYHDWKIANLIHWGGGIYNYESIDLGSKEATKIRVYDVPKLPVPLTSGSDFGTTITGYGGGYDTGFSRIKPFGTDYIMFDNGKYISKPWSETLYFSGEEVAIYGWQDMGGYWWSDDYDWMDVFLVSEEVEVSVSDPTLELTTYWDIEDYWDFGFVQISTDDGTTWISLENEDTTYDHEITRQESIDNLPGLTGWSENVVTTTFDLSLYSGETVLIGFRYITDWYTTYEGWYIMGATVSGQELDLSPGYPYPDAAFQVSVVYELKGKNNWNTKYIIQDLNLDDLINGQIDINMQFPSYIYLLVSPIQPVGHVDYSFQITTTHK